jgi:HJR/Mrr/RecB family endonuclease
MTWARWVISSADDFSDKAKEEAQKNNVILINGSDFSKMILRVGLVQ